MIPWPASSYVLVHSQWVMMDAGARSKHTMVQICRTYARIGLVSTWTCDKEKTCDVSLSQCSESRQFLDEFGSTCDQHDYTHKKKSRQKKWEEVFDDCWTMMFISENLHKIICSCINTATYYKSEYIHYASLRPPPPFGGTGKRWFEGHMAVIWDRERGLTDWWLRGGEHWGKEEGEGAEGEWMEHVHKRKHLWNRNIHLAAKTSPPHKTSVNGPLQPAEEVPTRGRMFPSGRTWDGLRAKRLNASALTLSDSVQLRPPTQAEWLQ